MFTLMIEDQAIIDQLHTYADTPDQVEGVALAALRMGLAALPAVRGIVDQEVLQRVAEDMVRQVGETVTDLVADQNEVLDTKLKDQQEVFDATIKGQNEGISELLETHREKILRELSLDEDGTAMVRLDERITEAFGEVKEKVAQLEQHKKDRRRSTQGGHDFEAAVGELLEQIANDAGDRWASVGGTPGHNGNSKKGDFTVTLGEAARFSGECIAVEAKRSSAYKLTEAFAECAEARQNRRARVGLFVWDRTSAREKKHRLPLVREGDDIVVLWDPDDSDTDLYLHTAFWLARSLVSVDEPEHEDAELQGEIEILKSAFEAIEGDLQVLEDLRNKGDRITRDGAEVQRLAGELHVRLSNQVRGLRESVARLGGVG